jgi:hypothetical protein
MRVDKLPLAPMIPYKRYSNVCIEFAIQKRMRLLDRNWSLTFRIVWMLIEQFSIAYGIEFNEANSPATMRKSAMTDTSSGQISNNMGDIHPERYMLVGMWHNWIDVTFSNGWAAICWDYIAVASGWKKDRLLFEFSPTEFEAEADMELLEELMLQETDTHSKTSIG